MSEQPQDDRPIHPWVVAAAQIMPMPSPKTLVKIETIDITQRDDLTGELFKSKGGLITIATTSGVMSAFVDASAVDSIIDQIAQVKSDLALDSGLYIAGNLDNIKGKGV